ncbi:WhiB family transcriptional regulator [Streptomyces mirabilis]|uniref:Transcriptional regulator WhiB n=1 Tax=Streptomyces mirabilis TaxID=68239 RepID=A0ABU3V6E6_9ACTN|nr:WhiB family transcriptional regulator [Streptomyces mirabilis]MCX5355736.1 WhiB family transcriptional regulator [Streptomyces mirabilis]MDU9001379.1 WhiB family transcriptional regulator [Streptomyces mirabilis]
MTRPSYPRQLRPVGDLWDWQRHAACRGMDSSIFYSPANERGRSRREREERARRVCAECPVREQCAGMALAASEHYGVWGGLSEADRNRPESGDLSAAS